MRPGVQRETDVGLCECVRIVGPVAAHRDQPPLALFAPDQRELVLRRRLREEIVDSGFRRDRGGGERVIAGDHYRADAHFAKLPETLADSRLDDVLEVALAEQASVPDHHERGVARTAEPYCDI